MSNLSCIMCSHNASEHRRDDAGRIWCHERNSYENNDFCRCSYVVPSMKALPISFYVVRNAALLFLACRKHNGKLQYSWANDASFAKVWRDQKEPRSLIKRLKLSDNAWVVEYRLELVGDVVDKEQRQKEIKTLQDEISRAEQTIKEAKTKLRNL